MTHTTVALEWISAINPLTTISLVISLMAVSIGFYAYGKTQKTQGSVLVLGLCLTIGIWVFASAFIFRANPADEVWFWYYVQSFGFMPMWPILIHFFTVISGLNKLPGRVLEFRGHSVTLNFPNLSVAVQYLIALALHVWILFGAGEPAEYVSTPWGLRDTPNLSSLCVQIFTFMTLFWYAEGAVLLVIFWKRAHQPNASVDMRKQSEIVSLTGIVFGGITLVLNIIFPSFKVPIPAFGSLFIGIWIMSMAYAIAKYNLGAKDEQIIGHKAFDLSEEPMVVTDTNLNVLFYNRAFTKNFERVQPGVDRKVTEYFLDENGDEPDPGLFLKEGLISTLSAPAPDGTRRFYNVKTSLIYNRKEFDRILYILSDITEIAIQKQVLEYLVDERTKEINRQLVITEKYTRPSLVKVIQSGGDPTNFEPSNREIAIMFADIRDFTPMSQRLSSAETVRLLNTYFTSMNECIVRGRGEIDKLIGDAIMALFENADDAVTASIDMIESLGTFNGVQDIVKSPIRSGIGINYGPVTRGNIGSKEKLDYTVIGDSVNAASRFEALTKRYQLPIVVSEEVVEKLTREYRIRFIDSVLVKGREVPTRLYEVFDYNGPELIAAKLAIGERLEEAFAAYSEGDFERAIRLYLPLSEQYGKKDPLLDFYVQRSRELLALQQLGKLGPWNGTYQFLEK